MKLEEAKMLAKDFHDWLTLPMTKMFINILNIEKEELLQKANQIIAHTFYRKELNEGAVQIYAKADGINTVLALMDNWKENNIEDTKTKETTLELLFKQIFEVNDNE